MYNYEQRILDIKEYLKGINLEADLSEYKNAATELTFTCLDCGNVFSYDMRTLKNISYPCPACRDEKRAKDYRKKVAGKFMKRFTDLGLDENYEVVEFPEIIKMPAKFRHLECGNVITTSLQNLSRTTKGLQGFASGCEYCSGTHTYTEGELKAYIKAERPTYQFIRSYMNDKHHLQVVVKHLRCGHERDFQANYFMRGEGCRYCNVSGGEEIIGYTLDNLGITYEAEKSFADLRNEQTGVKLRYDFYVHAKNLLIEYDGKQHTGEGNFYGRSKEDFEKSLDRDKQKDDYAFKNNIKLVRIPYMVKGSKLMKYIEELVK